MWHHATVECIPWHTEETIKTLMDICKEQSCWSCKKCSNIMKKLNGRLATVEKDLKEVKHELGEVKAKQSDTDLEVANLRKDVAQVRKSTSENSAKMSAEVLTEMKDREDRKHNVIILGLKESPSSTNPTEMQAAENDLLNKLFSDMELPADTSEKIKFRTRLGKVEAGRGPRPFLVKFQEISVREDVLKRSRKVTKTGIRIKPDLTKMEREQDEQFKKTIDEENQSDLKDESGDFRWKVAGPPGNLRKVKMRNIQEWEEAQTARMNRLKSQATQ